MKNTNSPQLGLAFGGTEPSEEQPAITFVREVTATYRGPRRAATKITDPKDGADFIRKSLPDNSREHFVVLYLDGKHQIIAYSIVFTGTANKCQVHPREIFQRAVLVGSVAIILGHNHPSDGEVIPSEDDRNVTNQLKKAGDMLGIKVLDHVIVNDTGFYSFTESQKANQRRGRTSLIG